MVKLLPAAVLVLCACTPLGDELADPTAGHAVDDLGAVVVNHRRVSRILLESDSMGDIRRSHVVADFYDETPAPITETVLWEGSCRIAHIQRAAGSFVRQPYDVGTLRVLGGSSDLLLAAAGEAGSNGYPAYSSDIPLFLGGETLTVSALRAGTVALETDLVAPHAVVITEPRYPPDNKLMVDRYHDLDVFWSGSSAGELVVQMSAVTQPGESSVAVECFFPAAEGWGRISLWAFQEIPEDAAIKLSAQVRSTEVLELPHWGEVEIQAATRALLPSGAVYGAAMEFWPLPDRF